LRPCGFAISGSVNFDVAKLPESIDPMLAKLGEPFDSPEFLYEIKWDGTRAICFRDDDDFRLKNRRNRPQKERYPELECLRALPDGTVIDGEIVIFKDGKPSFEGMLKREQAAGPRKVAAAMRGWPASYVVFDLLYVGFDPIMNQPCRDRRDRLREMIRKLDVPCVVMSEGVEGTGLAYYEQAVAMELEGIVAKRLTSPYLPGQRTDHWIKCKRRQEMLFAIVGYQLDESKGLRSVIIAGQVREQLQCLGKVGTGLTERMRRELLARLKTLHQPRPTVPCDLKGVWLRPGLFCKVSYLEITSAGQLRAPVFEELIEGPEAAGDLES
jgi:DNA ligase D-like protein (predicted ligase)